MANVCWWFFFSKIVDLCDTVKKTLFYQCSILYFHTFPFFQFEKVFFVLRKKGDQLTFLHTFHHR